MQTKTVKNSIPSLLSTKPWTLHFNTPPPPGLENGNALTVINQVANLDTDSITGVITDKAGTQYPLNGQIDEELTVTFFVTSGASVYFFRGTAQFNVEEMSMRGLFTSVKMTEMEDGNWSATATPPPDEDGKGRHHRRHAPRGSR